MTATAQDVLGVVSTAVAAGGVANKLLSGLIDGRVKAAVDKYTLDGTEAVGSTITFGPVLPKGANVLAIILAASVAQSSLTFTLGDGHSATRYVSSANSTLQTALTAAVIPGLGYIIGTNDGDTQIVLTTAGATATAGDISCIVLYTLD